ncbi:LTA synthase family protein [Alkalibacterium iburiense]|uniref:LTA synthase family protein n=1 Tax=Alkalibacterium iburiense TaxID=290589 RepID=A0ABP3H9X2_9LACT
MSKLKSKINKRMGLFILTVFSFWLKTYVSYLVEFDLGVTGLYQHFLLFINPLAIALILFSLSLYVKKERYFHFLLLGILFILSLLLYSNILYYREFTDFLTSNIIVGSNNVSGALITSTLAMVRAWDFIYWIDFIALTYLIISKKINNLSLKEGALRKRSVRGITALGILTFFINLGLAEIDRPQLLTRTFDRNYIVKYLGINFFTGYDIFQTVENNQIRAKANESDLRKIVTYSRDNHVEPNPDFFGVAKDRNVIVIALESVQQFLIDFELEDENGQKHEVMPFINSLFNHEDSYSFENFFHQTGQGKSADAEVLVENSLFGLPQGSVFQTLGSTNTFHATPNILDKEGYTTAAFHGNVGSFWNRTDTYQRFGYDYFFDAEFYDVSGDRSLEYGLKDKLFFHDSVEYLEQLPQPFYSKFITVTHHFPYPLDEQNAGFPLAQTADETINQYFATANYADQAIEEFFTYLKETGLYDDTIFVLYGDHYGVSNMRNPHLAELVGVESEDWGEYHNTHMQRVPLIMHIPGVNNGFISDKYSGQVDVLPTLMHLLGLETSEYLFMGQDILSEEFTEQVVLRNGRVITPEYSFIGQHIYNTETGEDLTEDFSDEERLELDELKNSAREVLSYSDEIVSKDLLRFYKSNSLGMTEPNGYLYANQLPELENDPNRHTSLIGLNNDISTSQLYQTNAPELLEEQLIEEQQKQETIEAESNIMHLK